MELDKRVQDVRVEDTAQFLRTGNVLPQTRYTFFVGGHGPFTLTYARGADTEDQVHGDITAQVRKLESLGIIPKA
jgi:hypothetical protein